jgi:two-component system, LytTR family, response regulator
MNVVIIDDESTTLFHHAQQVSTIPHWNVIKTYQQPSLFIQELPYLNFDLLLCDIELPGMNGLEIAQIVGKQHPHVKTVFLSAYSQYAITAFRLEAFDYLLKPLKHSELLQLDEKLSRHGVKSSKSITMNHMIRCFEHFEIMTPQGVKVKWTTQKAKELAMFLVFHQNKPLIKSEIIKSIWSDLVYTQEDSHFHMAMYRLRKTIQTYSLDITIHSQSGSKDGYMIESTMILEYDQILNYLQDNRYQGLDDEILSTIRSNLTTPLLWEYDFPWIEVKREQLRYTLFHAFEHEKRNQRKLIFGEMFLLTNVNRQKLCIPVLSTMYQLDKAFAQSSWLKCRTLLTSKFIEVIDPLMTLVNNQGI